MIHICFGASVTGALRHAFRKSGDGVIGFPVDFSIGPVADIDQDPGIHRHFQWQRETLRSVFGEPVDDESRYREALRQLRDIPSGSPVTIWTCNNASEQFGLRLALLLLKDRQLQIWTVNTAEAMDAFNEGLEYRIEILHSGECSPEQLVKFYGTHRISLPAETASRRQREGEQLLRNQSLVRSWTDGRVSDEPVSRDDRRILGHAKKLRPRGFLPAARLIGEVIGHADRPMPDLWIEYRIRMLIEDGLLEYRGDLHSMRMYEVRAK